MQFRIKKSYIFLHIPLFYSTDASVFEPQSIIFIHFFAVYCYGNLFKAGQLLRCNNLTLVMAYGEKRDIVQDGKNSPLCSCLRLAFAAITISQTGADTCVSFLFSHFNTSKINLLLI